MNDLRIIFWLFSADAAEKNRIPRTIHVSSWTARTAAILSRGNARPLTVDCTVNIFEGAVRRAQYRSMPARENCAQEMIYIEVVICCPC